MEVKRLKLFWRTPLFSLLGVMLAATAALLALRFYIIEPESVALACAGNNTGWRCLLREMTVWGFLNNAFGIAALITGALATVARWRWLALLAVVTGVAGAVLYTFELSGVGLLLGALVWVHRSPGPERAEVTNERRASEQQA